MKIFFISLGCDKNLADSEQMLWLLTEGGFELTNDEWEADVIVVNTCCFIHDAKEESIETILEMATHKKKGKLRFLIVAGCLAQRYQNEIIEEVPEVDAVIGTTAYDELPRVLEDLISKKQTQFVLKDIDYLPEREMGQVNTTGGYYSYLKIAEGCDKFCTYCIIPSLRGSYRSVPMERLIKEAEAMADRGIRELILVAQETTLYGVDLYGEKSLAKLLRRLCRIEGIYWIRLLYCYPEEIEDSLIQAIKEEKKVCNYLDIPIQHSENSILKQMGRRTSREDIEGLLHKLRTEIPDIVIRTSLITGFPGETEEDHKNLLAFVKKMKFDRLGVFTYSKEEGTPAAKKKGQLRKTEKKKRQAELMEAQQKIAFQTAKEKTGKRLEVFIEGYLPSEGIYIGRTYMDAPSVDGYIFVKSDEELMSGSFVPVVVTKAKQYDLIGRLERRQDSI